MPLTLEDAQGRGYAFDVEGATCSVSLDGVVVLTQTSDTPQDSALDTLAHILGEVPAEALAPPLPPQPTALSVAQALVEAVGSAPDFPTARTNLLSVASGFPDVQ